MSKLITLINPTMLYTLFLSAINYEKRLSTSQFHYTLVISANDASKSYAKVVNNEKSR